MSSISTTLTNSSLHHVRTYTIQTQNVTHSEDTATLRASGCIATHRAGTTPVVVMGASKEEVSFVYLLTSESSLVDSQQSSYGRLIMS